MPTYDYVCADCGYAVEVMHSVHSEGPSTCPRCGGPMKKTFAVPAVHFKGSGWARKEGSATKPARADRSDTGSTDGGGSERSGGDAVKQTPADAPAKEAIAKDTD